MKTVLCYGDSNTWGYDAISQGRFAESIRWPGILRRQLGDEYWVIEEGLNGRTTVWDDPVEGEWKNGKTYLVPCLETHAPIDLVILMLGTNDLKMRFSVPASDISSGVAVLVNIIQMSKMGPGMSSPQVLLIAPPPVAKFTEFADMFTGAIEKSLLLGKYYHAVAELYGCAFLDASEVIVSWDQDGIHLAPTEHEKLGRAVATIVKKLCPA